MAARSQTGYVGLGAPGAWILGRNFALMAQGTISAIGRFQFRFQMPTIPSLIGVEFTSQAVIADGSALVLTHGDCKEVRS